MDINNIDFTTTAMPRPKILRRTYRSFAQKMKGLKLNQNTLYINIDPFPYDSDDEYIDICNIREQCIDVAKSFFQKVVSRQPKKPNYTSAYDWLWHSAKSEIIFNLEDDWELNTAIDVNQLLQFFRNSKTLYQVVLRAYPYKYPCTCTSPGFLHRRYYSRLGGKMDSNRNPETQTHSRTDFGIFIPNKKNCKNPEKYVIAYPTLRSKIIVDDIGRDWLAKSPYTRPQMLPADDPRYKKKDKFLAWLKK